MTLGIISQPPLDPGFKIAQCVLNDRANNNDRKKYTVMTTIGYKSASNEAASIRFSTIATALKQG